MEMISMLEIIIDGEGMYGKSVCNTWKDADSCFEKRVWEARDITQGYNKTWVTVSFDKIPICHLRFDLCAKEQTSPFMRKALIDHLGDLEAYYKRKDDLDNALITRKVSRVIKALQDDGIAPLHCYCFCYQDKQIREYECIEPIPEDQILTIRKNLAGLNHGFGEPFNVPLDDIRVVYTVETPEML
jgi:hypothetical protein